MLIQTAFSTHHDERVANWLRQTLPGYSITIRQGMVIVGTGSATGVLISYKGPRQAKLAWAFPSLAVHLIIVFSILFTGILPGLLVLLIVWLAVK